MDKIPNNQKNNERWYLSGFSVYNADDIIDPRAAWKESLSTLKDLGKLCTKNIAEVYHKAKVYNDAKIYNEDAGF